LQIAARQNEKRHSAVSLEEAASSVIILPADAHACPLRAADIACT